MYLWTFTHVSSSEYPISVMSDEVIDKIPDRKWHYVKIAEFWPETR